MKKSAPILSLYKHTLRSQWRHALIRNGVLTLMIGITLPVAAQSFTVTMRDSGSAHGHWQLRVT